MFTFTNQLFLRDAVTCVAESRRLHLVFISLASFADRFSFFQPVLIVCFVGTNDTTFPAPDACLRVVVERQVGAVAPKSGEAEDVFCCMVVAVVDIAGTTYTLGTVVNGSVPILARAAGTFFEWSELVVDVVVLVHPPDAEERCDCGGDQGYDEDNGTHR